MPATSPRNITRPSALPSSSHSLWGKPGSLQPTPRARLAESQCPADRPGLALCRRRRAVMGMLSPAAFLRSLRCSDDAGRDPGLSLRCMRWNGNELNDAPQR
ncbi:hypothetical protein CGC20_38570 [Leishmania donovani]|uniref:Uncharacterized protein n=1 Tax=Leishmania donovani TaxID=5661 RepID=A0A504Y7H2_LEIDO|nr:hypothetical protein CGC21_4825 [Leishmania donovani]TPP53467.1 hypothetical protein CGC20_38530 [Leishmania donovani]TPP53475.1 hypothetical protein CGC20_38570 [Leishmania donovani]